VSTAELPAPSRPGDVAVVGADGGANERLRAAMKLADQERKYDQARGAYEKIIADFPGTGWAKMAQGQIDNLETLKAYHRHLDEAKKTPGGR